MNPYVTGGGGVTFERRVGVLYLSHLLLEDNAIGIGDGRKVVNVAFQQASVHPVDDLVVSAALPDELEPSLMLMLAVRRSLNLVKSDERTRQLVKQFIDALANILDKGSVDDPEHRLGLVVAGPQLHAEQLRELANHATVQVNAFDFFDLVHTPNKFSRAVRERLDHLEKLVEYALNDHKEAELGERCVRQRTWELLSRLTVLMLRLESPDETDWVNLSNRLTPVARRHDTTGASQLRDRLFELVGTYSQRAAKVDRTLLRRDAHSQLKTTISRRNQKDWQLLRHLHDRALSLINDKLATNDDRQVHLDRSETVAELLSTIKEVAAVVVIGESGVGKSSLATSSLSAAVAADSESTAILCINLRTVPTKTVEFESMLDCSLTTLLSEMSAPLSLLVVDSADAVMEGSEDVFRYLVDVAHASQVKIIAVCTTDAKQVVNDVLTECFGSDVVEHSVPLLTDSEIDKIVNTFPELKDLNVNLRSRELLRRLVVVDLLVRSKPTEVPLTDADAMNEVWSGLVRRHEKSDRGSPDARELELLRLADHELGNGDQWSMIQEVDHTVRDGLYRDGLLRKPLDNQYRLVPEFVHDEVRSYAVAHLLLTNGNPASRILQAGCPRWTLAAARLACQAWLAQSDTPAMPSQGGFIKLQTSFNALVEAGYGRRWGDVPGEALLALADPEALLRDAWPELCSDDPNGQPRLARLIDQRFRDENGFVKVAAVEPVIALMLESDSPWRSGEYAQNLLRDWLWVHVFMETDAGHPLRMLLQQRIVEASAEADRRLAERQTAEAEKRAARTPHEIEEELLRLNLEREFFVSAIGHNNLPTKRRSEIPNEITDEIVVELLALLGPDLGNDGEAILRRVAQHAPYALFPALERYLVGNALASWESEFLAELIEAYYIDGKKIHEYDVHKNGIRPHRSDNRFGYDVPLAAYYRGPFLPLLYSNFSNGVAVLNHIFNHAAIVRARSLSDSNRKGSHIQNNPDDAYQVDLKITGTSQQYIGDEQVWSWYRGTTVGPYPCMSALQAIERRCDQLIETCVSSIKEIAIRDIASILLRDCNNLAMVGLVVGLLVRHLEHADRLLDPYLVEPLIWEFEFSRASSETSILAANSEGLKEPERRNWSLQKAAMFMVLQAVQRSDDERVAELRKLSRSLVANALCKIESEHHEPVEAEAATGGILKQWLAKVRSWAASLDYDKFEAHDTADGFQLQVKQSEDVTQTLRSDSEDLQHYQEYCRLFFRYYIKPDEGQPETIGPDELETDIVSVEELLENPPSFRDPDPWDIAGLVSATILEEHLLHEVYLAEDKLAFAIETVFQIAEGATQQHQQHEYAIASHPWGADRSAARVLPLLLLPVSTQLRVIVDQTDGGVTHKRAVAASLNLARAAANETRLYLGRSLDDVWKTPCAKNGCCQHEIGLQLATEMMRDCVFDGRATDIGQRSTVILKEPITQTLADTADQLILFDRLDGAIRALAPAVTANICISARARSLLIELLRAQRRSLLVYEDSVDVHSVDVQGMHTLVSARCLLTLAEHDDETALYDHVDAYADSSTRLYHLLCALSAAAEETPACAVTAQRIWPNVLHRVFELNNSGHAPFGDWQYGDMALAALLPNITSNNSYTYRELQDTPITWWDPLTLRPQIETWLELAVGKARCVDQLIGFLDVLKPEDQTRIGLLWVSKLVFANPTLIARSSRALTDWLIRIRPAAVDANLLNQWQQLVDELVVEGVTQLAPYSE